MSLFLASATNSVASTTASNTIIGPSNEDDHQSRLEDCKAFFLQLTTTQSSSSSGSGSGNTTTLHSSDTMNTIRNFLFDRWSVIRFQCYKSLVKMVTKFPISDIRWLITTLQKDFLERQRPWQELHGCLLGYDVAIAILHEDPQIIHSLFTDCLDVIGHIRNPIRDAAKDCLVKIGSYPIYRPQFLPQMLTIIQQLAVPISSSSSAKTSNHHNPSIDNEANTLKIDGLLNVIVDLVPQMKGEITTIDSSIRTEANTSDQGSKGTYYSFETLSNTMKQCCFHPASTVRQKAGNIITSMVKVLLSYQDYSTITQSHFAYLIEQVLILSLHQHSIDQWQGQEVCLMICEDILRDVTNQCFQYLQIPEMTMKDVWLKKVDQLHHLITVLQEVLYDLLAHPRFEVRRVVLQLLPTVARAKMILPPSLSTATHSRSQQTDSHSHSSVATHSSDAHSEGKVAPLTSSTTSSKLHHVDLAHSKTSFDVMLDQVWLSIYMKEYRHLHEVLHPPNTCTSEMQSVPCTSMFGAEYWSNEVHGRLLEVELRQDFHKNLEQVVTKMNNQSSLQALQQSLQRSAEEILTLLEHNLLKLAVASTSTIPSYVSSDFVEFFALSKTFLYTLHHRSNAAFFRSSSLNQGNSLIARVSQLEQLFEKYTSSWYIMLSYLQVNSVVQNAMVSSAGSQKSSGHQSQQHVFSFGNANSSAAIRPTVTELIVMLLYQITNTSTTSSGSSSHLLKMTSSWLRLKNHVGDFELDQVRLLPTLTDPATNPLIYTEEIAPEEPIELIPSPGIASNPLQASASMASPQRNSLRIQTAYGSQGVALQTSTPSSSSKDPYFSSTTSTLFSPGISAKSPSITSPNRVGVGCNVPVNTSMASFHSMNRWNCEAISPLLFVLTCPLYESHQLEDILLLTSIISEWLIHILIDPLWLDNRKFARKVLMESLPILVTLACQGMEQQHGTITASVYQVISLYLTRTLAEILVIEAKQMSMDIRLLGPLVKATLQMVKLSSTITPDKIQSVHQQLYDSMDRIPPHYQDILIQLYEALTSASEGLLEKHTMSTISTIGGGGSSSNNTSSVPGGGGSTPVKTSLFQQFEHVAEDVSTPQASYTTSQVESNNDVEGEESDEFSDWDEDDEEETLNTDSCNSASIITNSLNLVKDLEELYQSAIQWKDILEQQYAMEF